MIWGGPMVLSGWKGIPPWSCARIIHGAPAVDFSVLIGKLLESQRRRFSEQFPEDFHESGGSCVSFT